MGEISASLEDYLETIYLLQQKNKEVRITDIASELKISKPSVNRAVGSLKEAGYLEHEFYGTIALTKTGEKIASGVLARHTLIKRFLIEKLGVDEKTAEEDACKMEHVVSPETMNKLYDFITGIV